MGWEANVRRLDGTFKGDAKPPESEAGMGGWGALQENPVCTQLTVAPRSPLGCCYTLRWPPTPFMATRPGPWCWWLYLWVSLQGRLGQFGGGEQASNGNSRCSSVNLTEGKKTLEELGAGDLSPGCTPAAILPHRLFPGRWS